MQEQERLDRELALRLSQDADDSPPSNSTTPTPPLLKRSEAVMRARQQQQGKNAKYDLAKWKYAELRDTINTSCGEWWRRK